MKFEVLRNLEHDAVLYVKREWADLFGDKIKSVGSGSHIPVDGTGLIDLTEEQAKALPAGVVKPYVPLEEAKPEPKKAKAKPAPEEK
ncbi:MAG TPA: hypothetical protein VGZ29_05745 [Terriglobia bacterium]|nr:hypothetical protein [Terriglobia bacterium]